jgi:hypothetical protein
VTQPCVYPWANCAPSRPPRIPTRAPTVPGPTRVAPNVVPAHVLAFTGADIAALVIFAVVLIAAGLLMVGGSTWRRT